MPVPAKVLGAGTAVAFAEAGAAVALGARSVDGVREVARRIEAAGGQALPLAVDVGNERSMSDFVAETIKRFGRLDFAFNNATGRGPLLSLRSMVMPSIAESAPISAAHSSA